MNWVDDYDQVEKVERKKIKHSVKKGIIERSLMNEKQKDWPSPIEGLLVMNVNFFIIEPRDVNTIEVNN